MTLYRFAPRAVDDLLAIWRFIAADDPRAAGRVEDAIHKACALLASRPLAGQVRAEMTRHPVRFWTVPRFPNYLIVYDPATSPLQDRPDSPRHA